MGFRRAFSVEGLNLERFLAAAAQKGLQLERVRRTEPRKIDAVTESHAMKQLAALANDGGWLLTPGGRVGAGRAVQQVKSRWLLAALAAALIIVCAAASQMVWRIRIVDAGPYEADVRAALAEWGVHVPALRSGIDAGELRDQLEWRYPQAAWFECGWRGMTLEIRMVEGVVGSGDAQNDGACDVVAAQDGVVQSIVTRAGTPLVKPGDLVQAGQVLIRGEERTSAGGVRPVAARGSVYARVWITAQVQSPLQVVETEPTGRTHTATTVVCPWFALWRVEESGFASEDVSVREMPLGGFFLPLQVRTEVHYEADFRSAKADLQSVVDENRVAALRRLAEKAGGREYLVDNWVNWSIIEDEILLSVATGEMLVDIARQERSSGMAAAE